MVKTEDKLSIRSSVPWVSTPSGNPFAGLQDPSILFRWLHNIMARSVNSAIWLMAGLLTLDNLYTILKFQLYY